MFPQPAGNPKKKTSSKRPPKAPMKGTKKGRYKTGK